MFHLVFTTVVLAETSGPVLRVSQDTEGGHPIVSLCEENDKFGTKGTDRYYTQGLRFHFQNDSNFYWALTQEINTPADTQTPVPDDKDQPYSGVLYLTYGYGKVLERGGRRDCLFTVEGQVGITGPASGAETIQSKFHQLIGQETPAGWGTQIPNEPVFNLNAEFKRKISWDDSGRNLRDVIAHGQIQLGTIRTELALGAQARWGVNLQDTWGEGTIRQSSAFSPNYRSDGQYSRAFSSYFFADAQLEFVFKNYATDGTTFRESAHVVRTPVVGQLLLGATASIYRTSITYYLAVRSKDFETQKQAHYFGGFKGVISF
jgi:lipid A 3-O-deacylase